MRSARVDLPWSMWAMIEKLRMRSIGEAEVWPRRCSGRRVLSRGGGGLACASLCSGHRDGIGARDEVLPFADSALRATTYPRATRRRSVIPLTDTPRDPGFLRDEKRRSVASSRLAWLGGLRSSGPVRGTEACRVRGGRGW